MQPLDFAKIKAEGLEVDFLKYTEEGYQAIRPDDRYRIKTYGVCAQKHEGYFMIRIRIPGGVIRADQIERIASLAERFGHGSGHLTTRGNIELHSVKINDFLPLTRELAEVGITTRSACGHTFRNILGCHKNGICPDQPFDLYPWVRKIHGHVFERAGFYNPRMPNRLNVSFSGCGGCSADARINDIGFVAKKIEEGGQLLYGFELWAAGSLGKSPWLGQKLKDFLSFEEVIPALEAVTALHFQGDMKNVVKGRLKFLVQKWGFEKFRGEFEKIFSEFKKNQPPLEPELASPRMVEGESSPDCAPLGEGIHPQRQAGFYRVQFWVPLGEVSARQLKSVAELSRRFGDGRAYHTTRQNFEFHWVKRENIEALIQAMAQVGFSPRHSESLLNVVACPGTSFCSLAVTSSQGAAEVLMKTFRLLGWQEDPDLKDLQINISGCPNSCAKHQVADIGFSGGLTDLAGIRRYGYQLFVGGKFNGEVREGIPIKKGIPDDLVYPCVESLVEIFREKKLEGERFPDFVERFQPEALSALLEEKLEAKRPQPAEKPVEMSPRFIESEAFQPGAAPIGDLGEWDSSPSKIVSAFGEPVAVFKMAQGFRACQDACPHAGGSLAEGAVSGDRVTCPLHGWQFDLRNGECLNEPGNSIRIYPVEEKEGKLYLSGGKEASNHENDSCHHSAGKRD